MGYNTEDRHALSVFENTEASHPALLTMHWGAAAMQDSVAAGAFKYADCMM